mmetsp:Transcript_21337/g.42361  ORF Transcript_21337/g.42361 Transcript_21337/m.42361 type:complete len:206 (+) Transcript_21337:549-1166(+)
MKQMPEDTKLGLLALVPPQPRPEPPSKRPTLLQPRQNTNPDSTEQWLPKQCESPRNIKLTLLRASLLPKKLGLNPISSNLLLLLPKRRPQKPKQRHTKPKRNLCWTELLEKMPRLLPRLLALLPPKLEHLPRGTKPLLLHARLLLPRLEQLLVRPLLRLQKLKLPLKLIKQKQRHTKPPLLLQKLQKDKQQQTSQRLRLLPSKPS